MKDNFIKNQTKYIRENKIGIKDKGKIDLIKLSTIVKLESHKNYTAIILQCGRNIVSSRTLKIYEKLLTNKNEFLRVNRSEIINLNYANFVNNTVGLAGEIKSNLGISRRRKPDAVRHIMNFSTSSN